MPVASQAVSSPKSSKRHREHYSLIKGDQIVSYLVIHTVSSRVARLRLIVSPLDRFSQGIIIIILIFVRTESNVENTTSSSHSHAVVFAPVQTIWIFPSESSAVQSMNKPHL
jgi:hypothetical protein